jgi:hypothetical protein
MLFYFIYDIVFFLPRAIFNWMCDMEMEADRFRKQATQEKECEDPSDTPASSP